MIGKQSRLEYVILQATSLYRSWSHLRKECLWLGQSKYIHQKIQIGANIKMPAHFTANAGFPVTMPPPVNPCTRCSACRIPRP